MKVLVLFVQYDTAVYPASLFYLQKYLKNIACDKEIIVIDNKLKESFGVIKTNDFTTIAGDNRCWEFSAWQAGIDYAKNNNIEADVYLFVNDSFVYVSGETYMFHTMSDVGIKQCVDAQTIVGDLITPPVKSKIGDKDIVSYIRTHCFLLPSAMVDKIESIIQTDKILPMSRETKRYINIHLLHKWHRRKEKELYNGKTLALQNEMLLSAKIQEL